MEPRAPLDATGWPQTEGKALTLTNRQVGVRAESWLAAMSGLRPGHPATYGAVWRCGDSEAGLPSFQEHLLGVSGRIHCRPLASASPERWGQRAGPSCSWGVSEGMLGSGERRVGAERALSWAPRGEGGGA